MKQSTETLDTIVEEKEKDEYKTGREQPLLKRLVTTLPALSPAYRKAMQDTERAEE